MKKRKKGFLEKIIKEVELAPEAATGTFRLVMNGNTEVSVENVKKLRTCKNDYVIIETNKGNLEICGEGMSIREYGMDCLRLEGAVKSIGLLSERKTP